MNMINSRQNNHPDHQSRKRSARAGNERGVALILTLVMLVVLGLLGALSLSTSSTELRIAGNYRNAQIAFYNADVTEAYGPNNTTVKTTINTMSVKSYPSNTTGYATMAMPAGSLGTTKVRVTYLCEGPQPKGVSGDMWAYHYLVTTVGIGLNNSEFVVESEVVTLMPKPDDATSDC